MMATLEVYKTLWEAAVVKKKLECRRESGNRVDRYAVAVAV